ncbi:2-hydroxyacyl-CoA dehydratase subunit D [Desulfoluna spongiiphila]|uniref:Benzoyl-CoA reductase/2-hydroxyglutaryl-CoA dehydratase subunit, BcrC/BadD/HgdB n=1 Tax=Desulfoluna spongiiphila TaxID=419481 RepID=A0A1G5EJW6_9BACT|nr:2-hydroxyacyl-CoA dehydratase family protein [Desulfoluna spongiiphila]SCY27255.1 Benzoyl-CoA reductase/2-hydroxyglutaryl-CoA dehydratase subunit, BcrC/BadD/HgdB [Desulfoluna spongiiphila]
MKKIGWFCTYTPLEILHAAGALPVGIKSDSGAEHEDVVLGDSICSYVRSSMGGALTGAYDALSGVVIAHSCECMRRLADGWLYRQDEIKPAMLHLLDVPKVVTNASVTFFAGGLRRMKEDVEAHAGPVTEEALRASMALFNKTRDLFRTVDAMRKEEATAVTGREVEALITASWDMPREELNDRLEAFIAEKKGQTGDKDAPRIMVIGGPGNGSLIKTIEATGGVSVVEHMCTGLRAFTGEAVPHEDPYRELASIYLSGTPCPRMLGDKSREAIDEIQSLIKEYRVDGVLYYSMKFCANMQMQWALLKNDIPVDVPMKVLEGDISSEINEREVQSFIKRLKKRRKRNR